MIPVQIDISTWNNIINHQPATVLGTKKNKILKTTRQTKAK